MNETKRKEMLKKVYQDIQDLTCHSLLLLEDPLWERLKILRNHYAHIACENLLSGKLEEAYHYAEYADYVNRLYFRELLRETKKLASGGAK
jgi:pyruvate carboxylase